VTAVVKACLKAKTKKDLLEKSRLPTQAKQSTNTEKTKEKEKTKEFY